MNQAPWLDIAKQEIGVSEVKGNVNNPRILEYHKATSLKATDDETPWCSAFVNWCLLQSGINGTNSARARSWLCWGKDLPTPKEGCVVVIKRGKDMTQGHVFFYIGEDGDKIKGLGGNQSNKVCEALFRKEDVLGYVWPNLKNKGVTWKI